MASGVTWNPVTMGLSRESTPLVQPGAKISYRVTADAMGAWAYHCHLIYHMPAMFRKVVIS